MTSQAMIKGPAHDQVLGEILWLNSVTIRFMIDHLFGSSMSLDKSVDKSELCKVSTVKQN